MHYLCRDSRVDINESQQVSCQQIYRKINKFNSTKQKQKVYREKPPIDQGITHCFTVNSSYYLRAINLLARLSY